MFKWDSGHHSVKSVRIRSYSGPYSVRIQENTDQNNSENGHFTQCTITPSYGIFPPLIQKVFSYSDIGGH